MRRLMITLTLLQAGCLDLDEEHCLANGGDLACPGQRCLIQTNPAAETKSDELGCSYDEERARFHIHLPYGLPGDFGMGGGHPRLDTVEGLLSAWREEEGLPDTCRLGNEALEGASEELADVYVNQTYGLRRGLDKRIAVRRSAVILDAEDDEAVEAYNEAMFGWLEACRAMVADQGSGDT